MEPHFFLCSTTEPHLVFILDNLSLAGEFAKPGGRHSELKALLACKVIGNKYYFNRFVKKSILSPSVLHALYYLGGTLIKEILEQSIIETAPFGIGFPKKNLELLEVPESSISIVIQ